MRQIIDDTLYDTANGHRISYGNCGGLAYQGRHTDSLYRMPDGVYVVDRYEGYGRVLVKTTEEKTKVFTSRNETPEDYLKAFPAVAPTDLRAKALALLEQARSEEAGTPSYDDGGGEHRAGLEGKIAVLEELLGL